MADNILLTMTVYYNDPPYISNLVERDQSDDDFNQIIPLSPVVRLEPDNCQFTPDQNKTVILQLPIPYAHQLGKLLQLDDIQHLPIRITCRKDKENYCQAQNIKYHYQLDKDGQHCLVFAVNHFCDYLAYATLNASIQIQLKPLFPSYQQQVKVLAYLFDMKYTNHSVKLRFILMSKNADEKAIMKDIKARGVMHLDDTGLEQVVIENGQYRIEFRQMDMKCTDQGSISQMVLIDWNRLDHYLLDYNCTIINPCMPWFNVARIFLKPIDQQKDSTLKCCFLNKMGCG